LHLDINALITQYGYLALFIGCIAEGETFTLLGGVAAHEGLLHYVGVVLAAMGGGICRRSTALLGRSPLGHTDPAPL